MTGSQRKAAKRSRLHGDSDAEEEVADDSMQTASDAEGAASPAPHADTEGTEGTASTASAAGEATASTSRARPARATALDSSSDDATEDEKEERGSQPGKRRRSGDSSPSASPRATELACGKVMQVRMVDFMCHKNLTVDLGPWINFVTGAPPPRPSSHATPGLTPAPQACVPRPLPHECPPPTD